MALQIPILRLGEPYRSLDQSPVMPIGGGPPLAQLSLANPGLISRDLRRVGAAAERLRELSCRRLIEICAEAAERFANDSLPIGLDGQQSPDDYLHCLAQSSGLPHVMGRANIGKVHKVLAEMEAVLDGLTRGLPPELLDQGSGSVQGRLLAYRCASDALAVVLPSNSPGVNSIWLPSIALRVPVLLKPGREEPWTPWRIMQALIAAGCPREAFGFYPTSHEGAALMLRRCDRGIVFGSAKTTAPYRDDPRVEIHGPGWSKLLIGEDRIDRWESLLDVLTSSVAANGGRSCINASCIVVPRHAEAIAAALAERLASFAPRPPDDPAACLPAFANPTVAEAIDATIERGISSGAVDLCAPLRGGPRRVELDGASYLRPTVIRCAPDHALANTEYLFPFVSVVEMSNQAAFDWLGPTLVLSLVSEDQGLIQRALAQPEIQRLNVGPQPTTRVEWDQPHEGNLFEHLYRRRAFQALSWDAS